jgi:D-alanyl-D-alanine carboxypeptidase
MALRKGSGRAFSIVQLAAGALISASALLIASAPAEARYWRHHHYAHHQNRAHAQHYAHRATSAPFAPPFSAIVVDANSGRTLYAVSEDGQRHPASITKVMTLYLLFEQLEKGTMTLQTRIPISEHAAAQEPSKLGVRPGETISVDDGIKAIVTRSANDVAVAVAEAIGGDESAFALMMTRKARALGMANTSYRNASGLPNDEQLTSAKDLAILGRAMEGRFPRYFKYFSTHQFEYAGQVIGNHNHLLGRIDGVDGIKTGYTRASGFNLLTSVHRDGRSLIAVVMGGRSAAARDRVMENLIADHIAEASTVPTANLIAEAPDSEEAASAPAPAAVPAYRPQAPIVAAKVPTTVPSARAVASQIAEGDEDDAATDPTPALQVAAVKTRPVASRPARLEPAVAARTAPETAKTAPDTMRVASIERAPAQLGWKKGPDRAAKKADAAALKTGPKGGTTIAARSSDDEEDATPARGGWIIQIGATDDAAKATALLDKARQRHDALLAGATPVTEKVHKAGGTLYRARFAGLEEASAQSACRSLKRSGFSCFAARN